MYPPRAARGRPRPRPRDVFMEMSALGFSSSFSTARGRRRSSMISCPMSSGHVTAPVRRIKKSDLKMANDCPANDLSATGTIIISASAKGKSGTRARTEDLLITKVGFVIDRTLCQRVIRLSVSLRNRRNPAKNVGSCSKCNVCPLSSKRCAKPEFAKNHVPTFCTEWPDPSGQTMHFDTASPATTQHNSRMQGSWPPNSGILPPSSSSSTIASWSSRNLPSSTGKFAPRRRVLCSNVWPELLISGLAVTLAPHTIALRPVEQTFGFTQDR
jgi:hypothetical protein